MLVVDASALFGVLAGTEHAPAISAVLAGDTDQHAPHLLDAEIVNVAQLHERRNLLDPSAAQQIVTMVQLWSGQRWEHGPLLDRVWDLRHNVRSYDALYVALAERLGAQLVTSDRRLSNAPGIRCDVVVP